MIGGGVEAGPNAVLAMAREGYDWKTINMSEFYESITYPGLHKFILKYPLITAGEIIRSLSKQLFVKSLRKSPRYVKGSLVIEVSSNINFKKQDIGESVCCDGVCLTLIRIKKNA